MKKVLLIMAAALMTLAQCRKQETSPVTPAANTIKMTITAGPGAKTDITDDGAITWSKDDVLYVSDGIKWLGSLTLQSGAGNASGTFTGNISEISDGTPCHFFYLGHGIVTTAPTGENNAVISFASQDGSKGDALKYHLGHGTTGVTVRGGEATGAVRMRTEIAIAHINFTVNSHPYTGSVTMTGVSSTMTVSPAGTFSGSGDGIIIGNNSGAGDRYVTLIPTGTGSVDVGFVGTEGSLTFGQGIQANNLYGMATPIPVDLIGAVLVESVSLTPASLSLVVGGTATLTATVLPENATDPSVTWSSNNTSVATVSGGVVTAVALGEATITVTTVDGGKIATCTVKVTAPKFSVSSSKTVEFAPGNLYYDGTDGKWKFEANQWDFRTYSGKGSCINGVYNKDGGTPANNWGQFGWSTSSTDYGMSTSMSSSTDYSGNFRDWGKLAIGSDVANTWRTLTQSQWEHLLNTRTNASKLRALVTLKITETVSVPGLVILPDGSTATAKDVDTKEEIASSGAVFLPCSGRRAGENINNITNGYYWSGNNSSNAAAYSMEFSSSGVSMSSINRCYGCSVRLVRYS